ncbi:MAG: MBL fold metallo-hydrolase [Firmicutes bacterium]|nr:MBL fold metallo-hydrolase [Bacillota bacterium]
MKTPLIEPVHLIKGKTPFPNCNCLLIEDRTRTVVDTGMEHAVLLECDPLKVDLVLNTHAHVDHMHGNWGFQNARIGFHRFSEAAAQDQEVFGQDYILSMWSRLMPEPLDLEYVLGQPGERMLIRKSTMVAYPASRVDFTFESGDELDLGRVKLRAVYLPGHCRGHSGFYWEKEGLLFSADIDFSEGGPWYYSESADIDEFIDSINRIIEIDPRIIVPGHGRVIKAPIKEAARRFLEHFSRRDETILRQLARPCTLESLMNRNLIIPEYIRPTLIFWEKVMFLKHLNRLIGLGEVREEEGVYYRVS